MIITADLLITKLTFTWWSECNCQLDVFISHFVSAGDAAVSWEHICMEVEKISSQQHREKNTLWIYCTYKPGYIITHYTCGLLFVSYLVSVKSMKHICWNKLRTLESLTVFFPQFETAVTYSCFQLKFTNLQAAVDILINIYDQTFFEDYAARWRQKYLVDSVFSPQYICWWKPIETQTDMDCLCL